MDAKQRCQSCGMPLGEGYYGTDIAGDSATEYCKYCYQNGSFTEPDIKLDQMIHRSVQQMTGELKMPSEQAQNLASATIPQLKRWRVS